MKKYLLFFFISLSFTFTFYSQNNVNVKIEIIADSLPDGTTIYITGNEDQLGNWQPNSIELDKIENGKWSKSFSFTKGKKVDFKFTLGSWDNEALNDDGSIPENHTIEVLKDTTIEIIVNLWADQVERKIEGQITGTVRYHRNFLGE